MAETPEQLKARERAAALKARKTRMANVERRGDISAEEMVKDLVRVSKISFGLGPSAARDRYRRFGHFTAESVGDVFGTHQEFKRAAGLCDSRESRRQALLIARVRNVDNYRRYTEKHITPWVGRFERKLPKDEFRVLVGSDFHSQYCDPFALAAFIETAAEVQPEVIALNGDVVEFSGAGKWSKRPGLNLSLQSEIDFARREILRPLREACPDAQIDWHIGNHEDRLARDLTDTAPELASLDCMQFDKLFSLRDLEINLVFGDSILGTSASEKRTDTNERWKVYGGCYVVTHHTPGGNLPGKKQLSMYGMSGCSGHVHRQSYYIEPSLAAPSKDWVVSGMMAGQIVGRSYRITPSMWSMGFVLATVLPDREIVFQEAAAVKDGTCVVAGMRFDETDEALKVRQWQRENL